MVQWPKTMLFKHSRVKEILEQMSRIEAHAQKRCKIDQGELDDLMADGDLFQIPDLDMLGLPAQPPPVEDTAPQTPIRQPMDPLPLPPIPPPTPTRPTLTHEAPQDFSALKDANYEKKMIELVQAIHKCNGEWNRKHREYCILYARGCKQPLLNGSEVLKRLKLKIDEGVQVDQTLEAIEKKHATGEYIEQQEIIRAQYCIHEISNITKDLAKVKFSEGWLVLRLATKTLCLNSSCTIAPRVY